MGNTLGSVDPKAVKRVDAFLAKYPKLLGKELVSDKKLFKTYSFLVEGEAGIIMKVYIKRERDNTSLSKHDVSLSYMQTLFNLNCCPNLLPYTKLIIEEEFAALVRPKASITLSERLQTVPTLSTIEKYWIIFQLLSGLYNLHQMKLYHGGIGSNNVLLTTWHHAFLADFAWFAPNYLYEDVLGDLNYYYPNAITKCNLAPEKFISRESKEVANLEWFHENIREVGKISKETLPNLQKMDVFSVGCVIAEIMLDGATLFKYEELLAYRRGQYSPQEKIERIKDEKIKKIIYQMIQKDPVQRIDITEALRQWATEVAPLSFSQILYYLNSSLLSHNFVLPDQRIALIRELLEPIYQYVLEDPYVPHYQTLPIVIQQNQILRHFAESYQRIVPHFHEVLGKEKASLFPLDDYIREKLTFRGNIDPKNLRLIITENTTTEKDIELNGHLQNEKGRKPELLLVAMMICSNIRNVRYFSSVQIGFEMLTHFSDYLSDHDNLHVIVPYLLSMLGDQNKKIVTATFNVVCDILSKLAKPIQFKSDQQIFENQIFPNLKKIFDGDTEGKSVFLSRLPQIINIGVTFVTENVIFEYKVKKNQVQSTDEVHELPIPGDIEVKDIDDAAIMKLQGESETKLQEEITKAVEKWKSSFFTYIQETFSSQQQSMNEVLLRNFAKLGEALGPSFTENLLIPYVIAALNDTRFRLISLVEIEKLMDYLSEKTINGLLKPVLEKCMFDSDEINVFQSVKNLHKIIKLKKLDLRDTTFIINNFLPLLIHPNYWIRELILELLCEAIEQMDVESLYFKVHPALLKYVKKYEDLGLMNSELFKMVVVDPISRRAFEELRTKGSFNSVKEPQMIDLCAILNEHFLGNINTNSDVLEFELKKSSSKVLKRFVEPKALRNIEDVVANFCIKTNAKHIKDLTRFGGDKKLSELIMIEADRDRKNNQIMIEQIENQLRSSFDIAELRNQLTCRIPELLTQHGIGHITYIKNLHNFYLFSANILGRRKQLEKKKNKDMGYHERYERPSYLSKEWEPQGFLIKTIYEHKDPVNCLDISTDSRLFASASEGGEIKIFDIPKLEADFSFNSLHTLNIKNEKNQEEFGTRSKIKTLKFLDKNSFVYGTDTGILEYHTLQDAAAGENQTKSKARYTRWEVDGEVKALQPLVLGGQTKEKSFIYVTHKGELGIQDLNDKNPAIRFNLGKERGMISTMLASAMDYTIMIGTQRGHVLLYDIRANLLTSMYQLSSEAPILSFANYYPLSFGTPLSAQDSLVGIAFGSDYHEVGFWNFSDFNKVSKNPEIYLYSSLNPEKECNPNYLKDVTKSESVFNIRTSFSDRRIYDYLAINAPSYNILSYFSDSIHQSQDIQRDKWLSQSKSIYRHANTAFKYRNSAHKIVCLPSFSPRELRSKMVPQKELQNMVITAGNDMNIRYWNLSSDKFYHLYNVDGKKRSYSLTNTDMLIYQENYSTDPDKTGFSPYQTKNGCSLNLSNTGEKNVLAQAGHKDTINDIIIAEKNEMVITCSRDKTIKVWK